MKRILLIACILCGGFSGFSQVSLIVGVNGGAGLATHYNYDMGLSYGANVCKTVSSRLGIGAEVMMQQYNLYYNKEEISLIGGTIRHKSNYLFISPMFEGHLGHKEGTTHFYITGGVGLNMGAEDTLHKYAKATYPVGAVYDSVIGNAKNINSMVFKIGFGFREYMNLGRRLCLTFTEDFAFLPGKLAETTDPTNDMLRNHVSPFYKPTYITFRIGLAYLKRAR